jgi:hypothetical protein
MLRSACAEFLCRLSVCLVFLVAGSLPAYASKDSVPDWVRAAAAAPLKTYSPETSAVVLLDETTLTVGADGRAVEHRRHVAKILSLHVWSIGADGHEYQMKDSEMGEIGYPGQGNFFEDLRMRVANPPGRDPGGVIAYEYEQKREPYLHEATWTFQDDVPRVSQSFTLELPAGYTYGTTWAHAGERKDREKAVDLEHERFRWEMPETPAIDLERVPMHPSMAALAGRMTVHYGPAGASGGAAPVESWQALGEWFDGLSRDRLVATPEIAAKAKELTAGKTDFYEQAEAIGEFVQGRIRYFVIEMGVGGFQPHPAGDIFKNGYGDCKDKATLLSAMLSSVGIHAALMMVDHRRGVVDPAAPSLFGDHMIAAIEVPKGYQNAKLRSVVTAKSGRRYLIFDPTWEKTAFGQLEHNLQGGYGLLLEGPATEIVELPVLSPELNTVRRTASFQLAADGSLKGQVKETRFGDLSETERTVYTQGDAKEQSSYLHEALGRDLTSFEVKDVKVENASALNKDLTMSYELTAERFGRTMGPLLMVRPRVYGDEGMEIDRKTRRVPVDLRSTREMRDDFTIELPAGYGVDELPEPVKVDVGFAAYESRTELKGTTLHYTRTYTVREVSVPAERYGDVQKLAMAIEGDEQSRAVFKKQ